MFGWFKRKKKFNWSKLSQVELEMTVPHKITRLGDRYYDIVESSELEDFLFEIRKQLSTTYKAEVYDCEDFAFEFRTLAHKIASEYGYNPAVATISYTMDKGGGHAISAIKTELKWVYVSSQLARVITLSESEIKSIRNFIL